MLSRGRILESSPKIGTVKNCTSPNKDTISPAKKYQYFRGMPSKRNDEDVGSVKIIGIIGIIIPITIISRTRVKKRIVRAFRSIKK